MIQSPYLTEESAKALLFKSVTALMEGGKALGFVE
jgi:hypothetical protein